MSFLGRVVLAVVVLALAVAAWQVKQVVLLLFGGLIVAAVLQAIAGLLTRHARVPHKLAVGLAVLSVAVLLGLVMWLIGDSVAAQFDALRESLPRSLQALQGWLRGVPFGDQVVELWENASSDGVPWGRVANMAGLTLGAFGDLVLMVLVGVFLAAEPRLYKGGLVRLAPPAVRPRLADALDDCGTALTNWLKGQAVSMLFVGIATGAGLALLGVPLALTLGLVAGLLDFVPFFGPIAGGVLAVLFAFVEGPQTALYVALLMLAIQQVEGNLMMPLVQRWAVALPPVLGLVAVVIFAAWFGIPGVVFATPLMVVVMVLVKRLYVEGYLERGTPSATV